MYADSSARLKASSSTGLMLLDHRLQVNRPVECARSIHLDRLMQPCKAFTHETPDIFNLALSDLGSKEFFGGYSRWNYGSFREIYLSSKPTARVFQQLFGATFTRYYQQLAHSLSFTFFELFESIDSLSFSHEVLIEPRHALFRLVALYSPDQCPSGFPACTSGK